LPWQPSLRRQDGCIGVLFFDWNERLLDTTFGRLAMTGGLRRAVARFICVVVLALVSLLSAAGPADAAGMHHAAVVVRHGNGGITYSYVAFAEDEINGAELLKRAGLDAVTISFGGLGEGVCMIEKEGCPPSVCQKKMCQSGAADSPFWQFYQLSSGGVWQFSALGASGVKIKDGGVGGWSWTGKDPGLPAATFSQIQTLSAQHNPHGDAAVVWRIGPAPAKQSRQSWTIYAGAGVVVLIALGAGFILVHERRAVRPGKSADG
jgi:hypothetical protein